MHILVALDGSSYTEAVTAVALQIAQAHEGSRVTALHIVNVRVASGNLLADLPGRMGFEPAVVSAEIANEHISRGQAVVGAFAKRAAEVGVAVHEEVRGGAIPAVLAEMANDADLVILGLRGETEDRYPGQGGRLAGVLPTQQATVLLVPKDVRRIESVLLGYDGSDGAQRAVREVRQVLVPLNVAVHGVFVGTDTEGVLKEFAGRFDGPVHTHEATGEPHHAILRLAKTIPAQVVALGFSGHSKLKDFAYGTLGEKALLDGTTAVMLAT
jgi:nucleotide-binding universal stress UspA family protein